MRHKKGFLKGMGQFMIQGRVLFSDVMIPFLLESESLSSWKPNYEIDSSPRTIYRYFKKVEW